MGEEGQVLWQRDVQAHVPGVLGVVDGTLVLLHLGGGISEGSQVDFELRWTQRGVVAPLILED